MKEELYVERTQAQAEGHGVTGGVGIASVERGAHFFSAFPGGWKKKAPYSVMLVPPAEGPLTGYTLEMAFSS